MDGDSVRLDPKAVAAIGALALIILVIIFIELCGRDDIEPLAQGQTQQPGLATSTLGPTFTPGPSPTVGPVVPTQSPTPMPGGRDRDAARVSDLQSLQATLDIYAADDLFARADIITLHTPLTDATRAIIDAPAMTGQMIALDGGQHLGWKAGE